MPKNTARNMTNTATMTIIIVSIKNRENEEAGVHGLNTSKSQVKRTAI